MGYNNEGYDSSKKWIDKTARERSAKVNGPAELITDPAEAHEVAHATKDYEEKTSRGIANYAMAVYHDVSDGSTADDAIKAREGTDRIANYASEAYKNGAEFLDLSSDEFTTALAEAPVYRKSAIVTAREAQVGEVVETVTSTGSEGVNHAKEEGNFVVTGVNGADFILTADKFNKLYEATEDGKYRAKGMARIIDNPTGKKIGILAPWGEMQYGDANAKLAVQYDPQNHDVVGADRYILDSEEFAAYKEVETAV